MEVKFLTRKQMAALVREPQLREGLPEVGVFVRVGDYLVAFRDGEATHLIAMHPDEATRADSGAALRLAQSHVLPSVSAAIGGRRKKKRRIGDPDAGRRVRMLAGMRKAVASRSLFRFNKMFALYASIPPDDDDPPPPGAEDILFRILPFDTILHLLDFHEVGNSLLHPYVDEDDLVGESLKAYLHYQHQVPMDRLGLFGRFALDPQRKIRAIFRSVRVVGNNWFYVQADTLSSIRLFPHVHNGGDPSSLAWRMHRAAGRFADLEFVELFCVSAEPKPIYRAPRSLPIGHPGYASAVQFLGSLRGARAIFLHLSQKMGPEETPLDLFFSCTKRLTLDFCGQVQHGLLHRKIGGLVCPFAPHVHLRELHVLGDVILPEARHLHVERAWGVVFVMAETLIGNREYWVQAPLLQRFPVVEHLVLESRLTDWSWADKDDADLQFPTLDLRLLESLMEVRIHSPDYFFRFPQHRMRSVDVRMGYVTQMWQNVDVDERVKGHHHIRVDAQFVRVTHYPGTLDVQADEAVLKWIHPIRRTGVKEPNVVRAGKVVLGKITTVTDDKHPWQSFAPLTVHATDLAYFVRDSYTAWMPPGSIVTKVFTPRKAHFDIQPKLIEFAIQHPLESETPEQLYFPEMFGFVYRDHHLFDETVYMNDVAFVNCSGDVKLDGAWIVLVVGNKPELRLTGMAQTVYKTPEVPRYVTRGLRRSSRSSEQRPIYEIAVRDMEDVVPPSELGAVRREVALGRDSALRRQKREEAKQEQMDVGRRM